MASTSRTIGGFLAVSAALAVSCSTSDSTRSEAQLCSTYRRESAALQEKYAGIPSDSASDDLSQVFTLVATSLEAYGDLIAALSKMERVAPEPIAVDIATIRDGFQEQLDAMKSGDLLAATMGGVINALATNGATTRLDDFLARCPAT